MSTPQRIVLIVEDDTDLRRMYRMTLSLAGFSVRESADAPEALRRIEQEPPDLVVLDLGLPTMSGLSVQQEIAASTHTRHIPVVIVTGSTMDLRHVDVPCVLRKPVDPDRLVETVRSCLIPGAPRIGS